LAAALVSTFAVLWVYWHGYTLYWGDAEAHLDIARRMVEARTTGYEEMGSPWLPLPHLLMLPFVLQDSLWRSGLAGAIPSALCFTTAAVFFFAAVRRVFDTRSAWCAMALFVLNPNALYVQSIPMSEATFFAAVMGILFFTTRYERSQGWGDLAGGAAMCLAASMTRYEGWILIPFCVLFVLVVSEKMRLLRAFTFGALASLGAAWWFLYNWTLSNNALDFYNGPNSAMAIQGGQPYPGHGDWLLSIQYFFTAAKLVNGWPLVWIGGIGVLAAFRRLAFWPTLLLALWPLFIVWSMHSSAQPIHVPPLPPFSWYNSRYALAMLPLLAFGGGALSGLRKGLGAPVAVVMLGAGFWLLHADQENWITWKESEQNSIARRAWTHETAAYLRANTRPTDTFFSTFGDISAVYREADVHFKRTLTWDDAMEWQAAVNRPELFLWEDWAIAQRGDAVDETVHRARKTQVHYDLVTEISVPGAKPIEVYRRHEYPLR
jgi:hypothetical protein